jgi:DNA-binding response OmpR family regulator
MGNKILVIDDSDQDRKIMKRFLGKAGFGDVRMAATGEEGVQQSKDEEFDIVVIDTNLPGINGFEACRQIRDNHSPDKPKIIVMTGAIDAIDAVKARREGADDYCVKTSDCAPLLEALKKIS